MVESGAYMAIAIDNLRAVLRPYLEGSQSLDEMLPRLWPLLLNASKDVQSLSRAIQSLLGAHAAGAVSNEWLRKELAKVYSQSISKEAVVVVTAIETTEEQIPQTMAAGAGASHSSPLPFSTSATFDDSRFSLA